MKEERRSISTAFWTDPVVEDLSKDATYLFNALLSFPENNMAGVYEITEKKIKYYTKMTDDEINSAFRELELKGKVKRVAHWMAIKNHIKNQKLNGGMSIAVVKDLCKAPNEIKIWLYYKPGSNELEQWFQNIVFNVNSYLKEQRNKTINAKVKSFNRGNREEYRDMLESEIPVIEISKEELLTITTEQLPFHYDEISNFSNFLTLTTMLSSQNLQNYNPPMNRNINRNINKNTEIGILNTECSDEKGLSLVDKENNNGRIYHNQETLKKIFAKTKEMKSIPTERRLTINIPNLSHVMDAMTNYTEEEIISALDNYEYIFQHRDEYRYFAYKDVCNFLTNGGLASFVDDSNPMERFRIGGIMDHANGNAVTEFEEVEF